MSGDSARMHLADQYEHAFKNEIKLDKPFTALDKVNSFKLSREVEATGLEAGDETLSSRIESVEITKQQTSNLFEDLQQTLLSNVQSPQQ